MIAKHLEAAEVPIGLPHCDPEKQMADILLQLREMLSTPQPNCPYIGQRPYIYAAYRFYSCKTLLVLTGVVLVEAAGFDIVRIVGQILAPLKSVGTLQFISLGPELHPVSLAG